MGSNQSIDAEKRKNESIKTMQYNISKLRNIKNSGSSEAQYVTPADTFKNS